MGKRVGSEGLQDYSAYVGVGVDAEEGEGQSEIPNALLNYVVYCCNVSCTGLSATHLNSH